MKILLARLASQLNDRVYLSSETPNRSNTYWISLHDLYLVTTKEKDIHDVRQDKQELRFALIERSIKHLS